MNNVIKTLSFFLLTITLSIFYACSSLTGSSQKDNIQVVTSADKRISVSASKDGLKITKKHDLKFTHITIHVKSDDKENVFINTDEKTNEFTYPFVKSGKQYSIYLIMMDKNWSNWTQSEPVTITAIGGLGDCYISYKLFNYDNNQMCVELTQGENNIPTAIDSISKLYTGSIYKVTNNTIDWAASTWGNFPYKQTDNSVKINISEKNNFIINNQFFINMEYSFNYNNVEYGISVLSNQDDLFTDFHPITNIELSEGTLFPEFNPSVCDYIITGTNKPVNINTSVIEGITLNKSIQPDTNTTQLTTPEEKVIYTVTKDNTSYKYTVTYKQSEEITFNGVKYVKTFSDDFTENKLDDSKWRRCPEELRQGQMTGCGWWKNDCSFIRDGNLVLKAERKDGINKSGAIDSQGRFSQAFGLYEIKFKCNKASGLWYAFWLLGQNDENHVGNGAVDAAEIDIFEIVPDEQYHCKNFFNTTIHWDGYGENHQNRGAPTTNLGEAFYDEWHVVKFVWDKSGYSTYLDEKLLWKMDGKDCGGTCEAANYIILSIECGDWGGSLVESELPAEMEIDYVNVYTELK